MVRYADPWYWTLPMLGTLTPGTGLCHGQVRWPLVLNVADVRYADPWYWTLSWSGTLTPGNGPHRVQVRWPLILDLTEVKYVWRKNLLQTTFVFLLQSVNHRDGENLEAPFITTVVGNTTSTIISTGNSLTVYFRSNSWGQVTILTIATSLTAFGISIPFMWIWIQLFISIHLRIHHYLFNVDPDPGSRLQACFKLQPKSDYQWKWYEWINNKNWFCP